jgi:hypothetical protein
LGAGGLEVLLKVYKVGLRKCDRVLFREIPLSERAEQSIMPPVVMLPPDGRSHIREFDQERGPAHDRGAEVKLASGSRLGPYEIVAHIGSGGVGRVYRLTIGRARTYQQCVNTCRIDVTVNYGFRMSRCLTLRG